jgi:DNA/RNA endonuclease YhcR with UshA esterase domain
MRLWSVIVLVLALSIPATTSFAAQAQARGAGVPKYDVAAEAKFKGVVEEVKDRECPISGGMGSHFMIKVDGKLMEVHIAPSKFVKSYEVAFQKGDIVEITGMKVEFQGVDAILAREIKRGNDDFVFRDPQGKPIW